MTAPWFEGFDTHRITTSGAEIFVRTGGTVGAPPLLLLHGFPQTHALWHRVAQQLARDYFLVLPDLRGYGDSSHAPGLPDHSNYSKRAMAQDMAEVITALGHDSFYLCGHDRGGRVAHRLRPKRCARSCAEAPYCPTEQTPSCTPTPRPSSACTPHLRSWTTPPWLLATRPTPRLTTRRFR